MWQSQACSGSGSPRDTLEPHLDGRVDESERLWPLLMFQLWHMLCLEASLTELPSFDLQSVLS